MYIQMVILCDTLQYLEQNIGILLRMQELIILNTS